MQRTQVSLEPEQHRRLGAEARQQGISLSALIRRLVDEHFGKLSSSRPAPDQEPLEAIIGIARGSGEPAGRDHNHYLYDSDQHQSGIQ